MAIIRNKVIIMTNSDVNTVISGTFHVNKVRWVYGQTAGDNVVLKDSNNNIWWETVASGTNYVESDDFSTHSERESGFPLNGIKATQLDSGTVYIYTS